MTSGGHQKQLKLETYQLEINNGPNHLHGGFDGFDTRNWESAIIDDSSVQFTLVSPDGDQGYPAGIQVTATYSLKADNPSSEEGVSLHLSMNAKLLPGETKSTPISLAQHSYFNLAAHSSREGILNHVLTMPNCYDYTPVDDTSIPTREVRSVAGTSMDFTTGKVMSDALSRYGEENGLDSKVACDQHSTNNNAPIYGFDHNYVTKEHTNKTGLVLAGILEHHPSGRSLRVSTTAPGVQLYTANYLNGMDARICKDHYSYNRWQGICLETQTYPDCIILEDKHSKSNGFEEGKCFVLRPGGVDYSHDVYFEFRPIVQNDC
jgi:aldose 1-epimerase